MVTPFSSEGAVDIEAATSVAEHLVTHGHDGLVVNGTTGESPTTSDREKSDLVRSVAEAVGARAVVTAGVGTNDTRHSVHLAKAAAAAGASGLLAVTPYYSKPTVEGVLAHFTAIADATDLPVLVYDIPGRTGLALSSDTLRRLAEHPRIRGVKDAKDDLFSSAEVLLSTDLAYYSGTDELNLAHLVQGAVGMVSVVGHVAGPQYRAMVEAVDDGNLAGARAIHHQLLPAVRAVMRTSQGAIMAKAAMQLLGVLPNREMRLPLVAARDDMVETLRLGLDAAGLLRAAAA